MIAENAWISPAISALAVSTINCAANTEPSTTSRKAALPALVTPNPQVIKYNPVSLMINPVVPREIFVFGAEAVD